jgi:triacylglycerol lipase
LDDVSREATASQCGCPYEEGAALLSPGVMLRLRNFAQGTHRMMRVAGHYLWLAAMVSLLGFAFIGQPLSSSAKSSNIDFDILYRAAQIANLSYDGKSKILGELKGKSAWVATPGTTDVQYVIAFNDQRKLQAIAVRGTANDANWALDKDTHALKDQKSGVLMHRGFRTAADAIYRDVKPRLKPGYTTYLTGHSLGGAVAAILGIYLQDDGVKLGRIFTFGQPKFTNVAGAKAYQSLPLLRVIYQNDTVALLPDNDAQGDQVFAHIGPVINILSGPYYVYGSSQQALQFSQGSFGKLLTQISLPDHKGSTAAGLVWSGSCPLHLRFQTSVCSDKASASSTSTPR